MSKLRGSEGYHIDMAKDDYDSCMDELAQAAQSARCRPAMEHVLNAERAYARMRAHCDARDKSYACQADMDMGRLVDAFIEQRSRLTVRCLRDK